MNSYHSNMKHGHLNQRKEMTSATFSAFKFFFIFFPEYVMPLELDCLNSIYSAIAYCEKLCRLLILPVL